jgi:CubicO group peptidase (beta-lactamase class C family)
MTRFIQPLRRFHLVGAMLVAAAAVGAAGQTAPAREPASKAAAILTWPVAKREQYIAALDSFFLTRTVKAGPHAHAFDPGPPLAAFEPGGSRASYLNQFMTAQRVRGILVLQDGKIRLERYAPPDSPATRWNSFSIAKSITSTLVGAAMKDGAIKSLDDPVTRYIKELRGSAYDEVNVRQLLTMTSGVKWNEDYTDMNSDLARMYALPPDPGFDMTTSYVRRLPREAPPGTKWVYKTSETNLVGVLVAAATGKRLADYLSEKIWRPYGMERDAEWMIDDVGHEQGGCCLAVTLRDYGRFGQFVLDGARIGGRPIVADTWLPEATRSQVSIGAGSGYGYQWWTRDDGTFEGRGIYGQTLHIDRARRLVIVINSATEEPTGRESGQARQEFIAAVNAGLEAGKRSLPDAAGRRF